MSRHLHLAPAVGNLEDRGRVQTPIRVVLADDHRLVRRTLRLLLDGEDGVEVVAEASDIPDVIRRVQGQVPHVLVLDLKMPGGSSIEAIRRLRRDVPVTGIVVLTMEHSAAFAQRAVDAGAAGFVLKDRADTELPEALRRVVRGQEYVSPHVAAGLEELRRHLTGA